MVKNLELEQNPFASNPQMQGSASENYADFIKTEARKEEVSLSNPFIDPTPAILQPNRKQQPFQDLDRVTQTFKVSQLPGAQPVIAPLGKEWDNRGALARFGNALIGSTIDTTGLALQGWADSIAAGTAWDEDDQRNFLEEFASGKDSTMWRAGQAMREAQREWFGDVDLTDDRYADDLGMAFGSFVPIAGAGILGGFAGGYGSYAAMALVGAGIQAGDMGERARHHGFDEYDIEFKKAVGSAFALGALEAIPAGYVLGRTLKLSKLMNRVFKTEAPWRVLGTALTRVPVVGGAIKATGKSPQVIKDVFTGMVGGAILEGGQEYAQAIGMDYIEQMFLDPEGTIGWTENIYEGQLGGVVGGTLGAIIFPFAKSRTRRIARRIEEEKKSAEGKKTLEELIKEAEERGIDITSPPIRTVLPESELDRVDEDTIDEGEFDYTEFSSPFGVDLDPWDDTGPDWRNDGTEYIDVWDPVGRKKKAKVIEREEKTGAALIEVDGVQTPLNTEYYDFDPKDPDFELTTVDGEGTRLKVKELSDEMVLKLLEDRRRRAREVREAGQTNEGGYHKHLQEGIALKAEAERRGIYKKAPKTKTVVEETVEEETEANLDPKDIADSVSRLGLSSNYDFQNREQYQLAENINKTDDIKQKIIEENKKKRRKRGSEKLITEKDADTRDQSTLTFNKEVPTPLREGKLTFITPEMAEKILGDQRNTENIPHGKTVDLKGGWKEAPAFDETPPSFVVDIINGKKTVNLDNNTVRQLNWFLNNGYKAIPVTLRSKTQGSRELNADGFSRNYSINRDLLFLQEKSEETPDLYNTDGSKFIHDTTTWSGIKDIIPQEKSKKTKPKIIEEKPSIPKFGPFGDDVGGKILGTDSVPNFALEYGRQILEKLNMQHLNIFFVSEQDFDSNGKLKPEVRDKFHLEDQPKTLKSLHNRLQEVFGTDMQYQTTIDEWVKEQYFVHRARPNSNTNGFVQSGFGPDSEQLHTYVVFVKTLDRKDTGALFQNVQQVDNERFSKDAGVLATIAHEIGHIMEWELFNNSNIETKKSILKDYFKYLQEGDTFQNLVLNKHNPVYRLKEFIEENVNSVEGRYINEDGSFNDELLIKDIQDVDNYIYTYNDDTGKKKTTKMPRSKKDPRYHYSFTEWFAEQSSRWALKEVKPKTLSEKFFDRVVKLWNKIFEVFGPVKSVEKMYSERAANPLWAQKFPNQKPPKSHTGHYNEWGNFRITDREIDDHLESRFGDGDPLIGRPDPVLMKWFDDESESTVYSDREGPFQDLPYNYRSPGGAGDVDTLTIRTLQEHEYQEIRESDLEVIPLEERDGTFVIYSDRIVAFDDDFGTGKVSQKTFKNPTYKQLLNHLGYFGPTKKALRKGSRFTPDNESFSTIETLLDAGATIDEIIADESVVESTKESVETIEAAVAEEIKSKTEEEVTAEIVEPMEPPSDDSGETTTKTKRPWYEAIFKWAGTPLQLFGMRNADGSYMYPRLRKIIERHQYKSQRLASQIAKILRAFNDIVIEAKKDGSWSDVSAIIVQGDREGKKYRNAQLKEGITVIDSDGNARIVKLSEVGIKAYHQTRNTLDKLGEMINDHNKEMKVKTRKRFNDLMNQAVELFNSRELVIKKLPTVEFKAIKDKKGRRVIGYDVTVGYEPSFRVMMSEFEGVDTGNLLKQRIKESSKVKNLQAKIIAERQRKFKEEIESINFEEEYKKRDDIFYKLSQMRRMPKKYRLDEDALNDLYNQLREIEKKIGYTKQNTPLDALIVSLDIESSRLKPDMDIMTNEGYLPHIWFGSHKVKLVKTLEDGKKLIKHLTNPDIGYWRTEAEAQAYAEKFIEDNPKFTGDEIVVENRGTTWADDGFSYRTIPDDIFVKLAEKIPADKLENVRTGKQSLYALLNEYGLYSEARRLKPSFEKERLNAEGYSTDTEKIVGSHVQNVLRYLTLDEMKYDAFELQQELDASKDPLAEHFRQYVEELIGTEQGFEKGFDHVFTRFAEATDKAIAKVTKGKIKGISRAGLMSGLTGLTVTSIAGIASAPTLITILLAGGFSYLVYGKVKSLQDAGIITGEGDAKVFDPLIMSTLSISAHTKLGLIFNLMSPTVNLSQTVINTSSIFNYNEVFQSMNLVRRYMIAKLTKSDPAFTEKWDALFDEGGVEVDQTLFTDAQDLNISRSKFEKVSMYLFQKAETINRMVAYVAGYNRAINAGKNVEQAKYAGQKAWNDTQFYYDKSDTSKLLRIKPLKVGTQFKNFLFKQIGFTMGIWNSAFDARTLERTDGTFETKEEAVARAKEMKLVVLKQLLHLFVLAGALGLPGLQLLDWLIRMLSDDEVSPIAELQRWNLDQHVKGDAQGIFADLLIKGAPTLFGQDLSSRVGLGNRFIPYNDRLSFGDNMFDQFKGPWISTLVNQKRLAESGATVGDMAVNISSGIGKPLKSIEMLAGGKDLSNIGWTPSSIGQYAELILHGIANPSGRLYTSGYKKSQTISKDISLLDIINYAIGGRPVSFSRESDLNYLLQWDDKILDRNVQRIYTKMARAYTQYADTNPKKFEETLTYLYEEAYENNIPINNATIKRMFQTLRVPRAYNAIKRIRKSERPEYFKYIEGYTL